MLSALCQPRFTSFECAHCSGGLKLLPRASVSWHQSVGLQADDAGIRRFFFFFVAQGAAQVFLFLVDSLPYSFWYVRMGPTRLLYILY